jgi:hypothetical protein
MLRRASFALGLALMGWAVFVIRAAHVSAVACTGTDVTKAHTILAGSCTGVTWPYLQGFALLIGGAFVIIFGLALGSARAGQERKVERQFRRDLKAGKYDYDPTAVVTEATIRERISMHRGYQVTPESAPIPYEQRFLKPFDDASTTLGEDAATEVAQTDGEKDREEGQ